MLHIEEEIIKIKHEVKIMFSLVGQQLRKSYDALKYMNYDLAHEVIQIEKRVNAQELKIDRDCENFIALINPVAVDLRYVLAVLKINNNQERLGDIAEGIARFILDNPAQFDPELIEISQIYTMFDAGLKMLDDVETAFQTEDTNLARTVFSKDEILDKINRDASRNITQYIQSHPANTEQALHILSIIRKLERVGDQIKNIAEELIFYVEAKILRHTPKKDL